MNGKWKKVQRKGTGEIDVDSSIRKFPKFWEFFGTRKFRNKERRRIMNGFLKRLGKWLFPSLHQENGSFRRVSSTREKKR